MLLAQGALPVARAVIWCPGDGALRQEAGKFGGGRQLLVCREGSGCLAFLSGPTSPLSHPTTSH